MKKYVIRWSFYTIFLIGIFLAGIIVDPQTLAVVFPLGFFIFIMEYNFSSDD